MTRPKFRPCPSCQTPNQASRKSCYACFGSLSTKQKINDKVVSLDSQWGQSVKKSRNVGRIIDSARIAVRKLEAVGYKPILFIGNQNKKASNKWVAEIITHLQPTPVTRNFLEKMQRAYEFILTKATSTAQQLDSDIPTAEQHNSPSQEQRNGSILEPESLTVEQPELPESLTEEQPELPESLTEEQPELPESLTVEQPESLTVEQPELPESLTEEQPELPESLTEEQPELPESLTEEQPELPESLTEEQPELPESLTEEQPELPESLTEEQPELPESLTEEQPELPESLTVEQPESLTVEQPELPESLTEEQPELPESLTEEQPELPESLTEEQPELPESLTEEQPMNLTKESETVFILNLVPLSSQCSPTSLSPPSSATFTAVLPSQSSPPPPPLPCSKSLRQKKKRTKTSVCSPAPSATSVSPPSLIPTDLSLPQSCPSPAASAISQSLTQEGPCAKKGRKGCRKCSRQKIFLFDKITGERINEGKAELKVHWLPCTVCGKTWDDTWEPACEFQHFLPESTNPNQLSP